MPLESRLTTEQLIDATAHGLIEIVAGSKHILKYSEKYSNKVHKNAEEFLGTYHNAMEDLDKQREVFVNPLMRKSFDYLAEFACKNARPPSSPYNDLLQLFCAGGAAACAWLEAWPAAILGLAGLGWFAYQKYSSNADFRNNIRVENNEVVKANDEVWSMALRTMYERRIKV